MATEFKNYIISFQATLKGKEMILSNLRQMESEVKKVATTTDTGAKATKGLADNLSRLALRAGLVIPIWFVMRRAFMAVIQTMSDSIKAFKDLDDQLARIRTVMHGDANVIEAEMVAIRSVILETSANSRIALKDLAEGFYFLKTSNLNAKEAMEAFIPTVNLATGTMNNMGQSARAVAGIYNTMGKYLGENLTIHEKFQKIADVLAYTYSTQDVQLNELIESYTKLAPYMSGLGDSFTDLTTMLGFLNTHLLRSGRAGRLTGQAIIQLTKNADKLANVLGVTFEPDKPITFLKTIEKIRDALNNTGQITAQQGDILQEVFATRGGVAVRLLIEYFDELQDAISQANEYSEGFAQRMSDIRMNTIAGQAERFKNILALLTIQFITGATGTKSYTEALRSLNNYLVSLKGLAEGAGKFVGWLAYNLGMLGTVLERVNRPTNILSFIPGLREINQIGRLKNVLAGIQFIGFGDYSKEIEAQTKAEQARQIAIENLQKEEANLTSQMVELYKNGENDKAQAVQKRIDKIKQSIEELLPVEIQYQNILRQKEEKTAEIEQIRVGFQDKYNEETKQQVALMKILGANALDIAKYELERTENMEYIGDQMKWQLSLLQARNKLIQEEYNYRKSIVNTLQRAEVDMAKVMGATEIQILDIKEKQLETEYEAGKNASYMARLTDLRLERQIALQSEKEKELQTATDIYLQYEKADKMEKNRIERLIELLNLSPEDLIGKFQGVMYDRRIILQYWNYFNDQAQRALGESIRQFSHLKELNIPRQNIPNIKQNLLTGDIREKIGQMQIVPTIGEINVNLPEGSLDRMAEEVGKQVTDKLKSDDGLQRTLAKMLRPYL